jgi:hypothetical protein
MCGIQVLPSCIKSYRFTSFRVSVPNEDRQSHMRFDVPTSVDYKDYSLLECDVVLLCRSASTFRVKAATSILYGTNQLNYTALYPKTPKLIFRHVNFSGYFTYHRG